MADYISSYSGTQIDSLLGQIKNEGQIQNMIDTSITNSQSITSTSKSLGNGVNISLWKYGRVCQCEINGTTTSAKDAWTVLATLPAGYIPHWNVFMKNAYPGRNEVIYFSNDSHICTGTTIPASTPLWFFATWLSNS